MKSAWVISTSPGKNTRSINGATHRTESILTAIADAGYEALKTSFGVGEDFDIQIPSMGYGLFNVARFSDNLKLIQNEKLRKIANSLKEGDVVVIDQPFLWPIIECLIGERKVLYIAHNYESHAYFQMLRLTGFESESLDNWKRIKNIEEDLMRRASAVICLSELDHKAMTRFSDKVIIVPTESMLKEVRTNANPNDWTFVSSNWPANWLGIIYLLDPNVLQSEKIKLRIVGSCLEAIKNDAHGSNWIRECGESIEEIGVVSSRDLDDILKTTYGSIIPVLMGGGANFKIAEAMSYRHRIISTTFGARGYRNAEGVQIADCRGRFSELLKLRVDLPQTDRHSENELEMKEAIAQILIQI